MQKCQLRFKKMVVSACTDEFITKYHTSEGCFKNIMIMKEQFDKFTFVVHSSKSVSYLLNNSQS